MATVVVFDLGGVLVESRGREVLRALLPQLPALFHDCFASHRTGLMKPERAAFEHALAALGAAPHEVLFFDDLAPNVAAARSVGMRAHQVAGFADIAPILRGAGLLQERDRP